MAGGGGAADIRSEDEMRVLICGGRNYTDADAVTKHMDAINDELGGIDLVIHGGAEGADRLGGEWAARRSIPVCVFPANWKHQGKAAGPIRNAHMLRYGQPDAVVAFPGGAGTANMIAQANERRLAVIEVAAPGSALPARVGRG